MQLQESHEREFVQESRKSKEALLHDFMATFLIAFIVAAKCLRKSSPKGHKWQEQLQQQPLGNPQRQTLQQHTVISIFASIIAVIMFFVVGSSTSPITSPKKKIEKREGGKLGRTGSRILSPPPAKTPTAIPPLPSVPPRPPPAPTFG